MINDLSKQYLEKEKENILEHFTKRIKSWVLLLCQNLDLEGRDVTQANVTEMLL